MCDLAMAYHRISEGGKIDEYGGRILAFYRRVGIVKWSRLLHSFLVGVIGLPEAELPYSEKIVPYGALWRIVEEGGNFGQHRETGASAGTASGKSGVLKRKLGTAGMFLRRAGFSLRLAPKEAFWTVFDLAKGQFRK